MDKGQRNYESFTASLKAWLGAPVKVLTQEAGKPVPWGDIGDEQRKAWADAEAAVERSEKC